MRQAAHLHGAERLRLIQLLDSLEPADWLADTPCPAWSVHDLATHILGGDLARLARSRDGWAPLRPDDGEPMADFINRINEEWVQAAQRISPAYLTDLLGEVGAEIVAFWDGVDLDALGEPVTWAGPDSAPVWLDAARDLSEYWIHRHQLAAAVGRPPAADPGTDHTVMGTLLHALPYQLRAAPRPAGTAVRVALHGTGEGAWHALSDGGRWHLADGPGPSPSAAVELDGDLAWRRWSRGATAAQARAGAYTGGDDELCDAVLDMVAAIV